MVKKQGALFAKMAMPYFKEEKSARVLLAVVIGFTLLNSGVSVGFSYLGRDFWTALSSKNADNFYPLLQKYVLALAGGTPVSVLYKFYRDKLAMEWRSWMTKRTLDMFEARRNFYELETKSDIDNPDQRIAEDARAFTRVSLDFSITLLTSIIDLASFSTILYSIYPELFAAILIYAGFGTGCTLVLGNKLVGINFEQLQREANFRFSLVRMRENAESIAFYGGEQIEMKEIKKRFQGAIDNSFRLISTQRNLELFTVAYRYMVQVIPAWVVAPLYFKGKIELGVVSQSYGAFNHILSDLSIIVNQFEGISSFSAGIGRLGDFIEAMESNMHKEAGGGAEVQNATSTWNTVSWWDAFKTAISLRSFHQGDPSSLSLVWNAMKDGILPMSVQEHKHDISFLRQEKEGTEAGVGQDKGIRSIILPGEVVKIKQLTLKTPDSSRVLIRNLNLEVDKGQHLLIVGNSGAGKSSLLRAIAGLWTAGDGEITRPPPGETFFLPQRPYCTLGSLREQLLYPQRPGSADKTLPSDEELLQILHKVKLPDLAPRLSAKDGGNGLDSVRDWSSMLSLGEQQRLAFGRLLANSPRVAILDEASSALDLVSEKSMYELLESIPHLTYISVGHRPSLLHYHDTKLKLKGDAFEIEKIEGSSEKQQIVAL